MKTPERLFDIPYIQMESYPQEVMFSTKVDGKWTAISTQDFLQQANEVSKGLIALGIQPGDKIALVSPNRYEWNIMDIGIQQTGAIGVPIYPNISTKDYHYIFNDAGIKFCVTGTEELYHKITKIKEDIPSLEKIYCFDELENIPHWSDIKKEASKTAEQEVEDRKSVIKNDMLATMIYTSGTTGNPKGVMLSHNNLISNVMGCQPRIPADNHSRVLSFLPVCHVYERMLHYLYMYLGCSIYFAESMETIGDNIREVKPHVFTAVPRLLEKVYEKIMAKGDELSGIKRKLFFWAVELAEEYDVSGKSAFYNFKLGIARKLIFSKWQEALGGNVKAIASGSAALQPRLARIFLAAGVPILEGYGLTETSPVISVNCFKAGIKIGSVGTTIQDVTVKIAEDGEILVKGPNVMMGYYNQPEKTAEAIDAEGWFHTGDIGQIEDGKFLRITDRKKEIFKTSGGKYIIPQMMENKFKESRFIEQIMVIGEGQKHPAALIVPQFAFMKEWAKRKNIGLSANASNDEIIAHPKVIERIKQEVDAYNENYGKFEQIKKFELLNKEMSTEGGELTTTLKFKRKIILEMYKDKVEAIYG
ncbi:long-chain acyl-CoA synthetase [Lishizhenia tianjinensis]|uniref:Long-chain acyl-CoA synthetase n=1 Tax=Lishizhenia tianjinensis TaxID=477690 RepID=A0A1I6YTB8_9FLAO|nr:AMP-dependent synthetase/ligase [Lishizhenia tianjinensis]SFT53481.1 long-chain acyl-CoA synthetase [Lishizhenia tianjinensis]